MKIRKYRVQGDQPTTIQIAELNTAELIEWFTTSEAFTKAWERTNDSGIGSRENAERIHKLILNSEFLMRKLNLHLADILSCLKKYALSEGPEDDAKHELEMALRANLMGLAVGFLATGAMTATVATLPIAETSEDSTPHTEVQ